MDYDPAFDKDARQVIEVCLNALRASPEQRREVERVRERCPACAVKLVHDWLATLLEPESANYRLN